jgi:lantibiotic modifying enzyme
MSYLAAAQQVGQWLLGTAERGPEGWHWPAKPGIEGPVFPGVGWGTAGPTLFFVEAFRTTGDERWLAAARHGARWMRAHLAESAGSSDGCGLLTGIGGWVVVLTELADAAGDDEAATLAGQVMAETAARASRTPAGLHWHDLTEILWGTAGLGCLMLSHGPRYLGAEALDLAIRAGDWLIAEAEPAPPGIRWSLGRAWEREHPGRRPRYPNFAHGAAGIAFFLARLAGQTSQPRFLEASRAAVGWIMTTVRTDDDTCAAYHHEPDGTGLFTLGWCHGPPGLGWLFRQLELTTGEPGWRAWIRRTARACLVSGIPERRGPGFWDNVARCCGSAGVAEYFLDLHRLESRPGDLAFARTMADDLLGRGIRDRAGLRWSNCEFRYPEPDLPPETSYLQGAAGIGSTLLRLHRHLAGDPWVVRWPHAPAWAAPDSSPASAARR